MNACPVSGPQAGVARDVLHAIDCNVQAFSKAGYLALAGPDSFLSAAVASLLVIYVGMMGFRLMFGVGNPRLGMVGIAALKIGLVLTLAFNWTVFQTLVFDLAIRGPLEVAGVISESMAGDQEALADDPLTGIQLIYDELGQDIAAPGMASPSSTGVPSPVAQSPATPDNPEAANGAAALARVREIFLYAAIGVPAVAMIAIGILTTVGPLFIALSLLGETAGLFLGWLRALLSFTILSMLTWITNLVMLTTLEPYLLILHKARLLNAPDPQAAGTVAMLLPIFAAAQAVLAIGAIIIGCGLRIARRPAMATPPTEAPRQPSPPVVTMSRARLLAQTLQPWSGREQQAFGLADNASTRTTRTIEAVARRRGEAPPPGARPTASASYRRPSAFERRRNREGEN